MADHPQARQRSWEGELFRLLVENVQDYAIFLVDAEGRVCSWSKGAERLLGYHEEEIVGQSADRFFTPEDVANDVPRQELHKALTTGRGEDDRWHVRKDGSRFWSSGVMTPLRDEGGTLRGFAKLMRDRTEWKLADDARRESEARHAAVLETALDAIITIDHQGHVIDFNPAAERLFGHVRADVQGRGIGELIVPPRLREAHHRGVAHFLATGEGPVLGRRVEMPALRADGTEVQIELAITHIPTEGPPLFTAYLRDISERSRGERRRGARLAVTQTLAEAATVRQAAPRILQAVCEGLGWDVGAFWTVDRPANVLRCLAVWHGPQVQVGRFEAATRQRTFGPEVGLPGRVWAHGQPAWIPDVTRDANFPRAAVATQEGLHGAFACPVILDGETLGVIEFFSRLVREPDADLLEMMGTVAGQIGQFMERRRAEEHLRRSERELADFFENATIGLHFVGRDGTILRVNRAELDLLGYAREEYVGHHIAEFHADAAVIGDILRRLQAGEELHDYPARLRCKDGSIRDVLIHSSVLWEDGQFVHTRCFTRDITERKRAADSLRDNERRFRGLTSLAPVGIFETDAEGNCLFVNEKWCKLAGMTPEAAQGQGWSSALHPDDREWVHREWYTAARTGRDFASEYRFRTPRGDVIWLQGNAVALQTGAGEVAGYIGTITDLTERKQAEQALRESEQRFARFMQHLPGLAWIKDLWGRYVYANDAAEKAFHTPRADLYGKTDGEVFDPDTAARFKENDRRALASGTGVQVIETMEHEDGVLHHSLVSKFPILGPDGKATLVGGMAIDITDRVRAEAELRRHKERLELAQRAGRIGTFEWNIRTDEVEWSATEEEIFGLPAGGFGGRLENWKEAVHPDDRAQAVADCQRAVADRADLNTEFRIVRPDGQVRWIAAQGKVFCDGQGRPLRMVGVNIDVTARKAAEVALQEADRLKDEFLAMLAHELRNPLAPVRNALHIMKQPRASGAILQQVRDMAERQVQHMARLLDDLLDVSRISRGRIELRREVADVAAVVGRTLEAVRPLIEDRRHELTVSLPAGPLWVEADTTRLEQVLTNLLNNAVKYTDPGGRIWLTAVREGGEAVLRVRDTGIGITPEVLPRIFDLFVQAERRLDRSQGGVGIGLTLVKKLVELHGGRVEAASSGPGRGSEFVVRLPALSDQSRGERARPSEKGDAAELSRRRVLVVDDNQDTADSLAMLLRLAGQDVRVAYDGTSALTQAEDFQPELVFLDIGMPGMDGYEVARRLRGEPRLQGAILVALTGWGQEDDRRRSAEAGFDHHLVKPVEPQALQGLLADPQGKGG